MRGLQLKCAKAELQNPELLQPAFVVSYTAKKYEGGKKIAGKTSLELSVPRSHEN